MQRTVDVDVSSVAANIAYDKYCTAVARSVILGMDDESIISHLSKHTGNQIEGLANAVSSEGLQNLLTRLLFLSRNGQVQAIDTVVVVQITLFIFNRGGQTRC